MGFRYKGNADYHHSIAENLDKMKEIYEYNNGLFGVQGKSISENTRNIKCDNPLEASKDFYDNLAYGGIESALPNGKGHMTEMSDGSIITYREYQSSDGSPVVDINIKNSTDTGGIKKQKIHFVIKRG